MSKRKKEEQLLPCAFYHSDCNFYSRGICRLLEDMDFHGKDCSFFATKEQVKQRRKMARERLINIGASYLINYPAYVRGKKNESKQKEC